MVFSNSFVTNSICSPARAVVQTGKFSHLNGVKDNKNSFDGAQQTFPKLLQQGGYQTALIGKWHLRSVPTGFDYYNVLPGQGNYIDPTFIRNGDTITTDGYVTDITTDFAIEFLQTRNQDKPFCLMLQHKAPHGPWFPAPRHLSMFKNDSMPLPETFFHDCKKKGTPACEQDMEIYDRFMENPTLAKMYKKESDSIITHPWLTWLYDLLSEEEQQQFDSTYLAENQYFRTAELSERQRKIWMYERYIKDYMRCVKAIDENVGKVLDYLEQSGLSENTIVMYSSDQGFYLGDFGWYDKRFMYDISMRTPLIARWPAKIKAGTSVNEMVQNVDMAETFLDIAGLTIPEDMQGLSLLPLMQDASASLDRQELYYHYYEFPDPHHVYPHFGVRTESLKLIYFYTINEWEFYDLQKDPQELINLYEENEYKDDIQILKKKILELQEKYKDEEGKEIMVNTN